MTPEQKTSRERVALDKKGFTSAFPSSDGRIHLDLWPVNMAPAADPVRLSMSAGQALMLIQSLADATQRALKETVA